MPSPPVAALHALSVVAESQFVRFGRVGSYKIHDVRSVVRSPLGAEMNGEIAVFRHRPFT